jgi:glycosyltransferase involved in cell wall biosynthesis
MRVSVVVPVYNKAPYLRECFDSIFSQSFSDMEIIAVDDHSTDGSLDALHSLKDPRLKIVALDRNLGPAGAMQRAIDLSQGEYIARMDADDIMMPDRLKLQVGFMDADPGLGASGGQVHLFGNNEHGWFFPYNDQACRAEIFFGQPVCQGTAIYRSSVLARHALRYRDEWPRVGEDWIFWAHMIPHTRLGNLPQELIRCRRGEHNSTYGLDKVEKFEPMVRLLFKALGIPDHDEGVDMHLLALHAFKVEPSVRVIKRLRNWFTWLERWNRDAGYCDQAIFQDRLDAQWEKLFYKLPPYGFMPALAHMLLKRGLTLKKMEYLVRASMGRLLKRGHGDRPVSKRPALTTSNGPHPPV